MMRYLNEAGEIVLDTSPTSVIESTLWDHRSPVRRANPRGRDAEPAFVWRCADGCDWLHENAADGGAAHFRHQAEKITEALQAAGHIDA